jgi:membrane fusion protein, heavy metal efflux system
MKLQWLALAWVALAAGCSHDRREAAPAESRKASGLIEIGAEAQKNFGMRVEPARIHDLHEYLQVPGTVQPTNSRVTAIRPLARGRLHEVLVRVGDRVRQGQLLATYDNIEAGELAAQLASARAELERLRVQERNLARQAGRARDLADIGAIPKKELEQAAADQQSAEQTIRSQEGVMAGILARLMRFGISQPDLQSPPLTSITSPLTGVITKQDASPGETIESTSNLFTVADLSAVWVQAEVYEKDLGRVRVGQPAFIHVDTYPEKQFAGKVTYVSDFLDPQTRTAKVRCEVPNGDMRLKLDMYANVDLPTTLSRRTLAVPAGAIQEVGDKTVVFVQKEPTRFAPRWVTAGNRVRDLVEITRGLAGGEPVVVAGAYHLKSVLVGKELTEE